ncbi:MAG: hypothetical protein V7K95_26345 [Nostoc sp.]
MQFLIVRNCKLKEEFRSQNSGVRINQLKGRLETARQVLQVGGAAQRTGLSTQAKPTSVG